MSKTEGIIEVGDLASLAIECIPEAEGHFKEAILVVVDDSPPEDKFGRKITLEVDSCLPRIDFDDLDSIFQDSYVVDSIDDFTCPKEVSLMLWLLLVF